MFLKKLLSQTFIPHTFSKCALCLIGFIFFYFFLSQKKWQNDTPFKWDINHYYSYLPAIFIHHDIKYTFIDTNPEKYRNNFWASKAPNGNYVEKVSMGMALMYMPFFLAAHLYANLQGHITDGFSTPYKFFISFGSIFYVLVGIYFLRKTLIKYFSDAVTATTLICLTLGTNLFYYTTTEGPMTHGYLFCLFSVFLYYSLKWHEQRNIKSIIFTGLSAGLIVLVRPLDIFVILIPLLYGITNFDEIKNRPSFLWDNKKHIILFIITFILVNIPQLIYWKYITGNWLYFSYGDEEFFWNNPHLVEGLFGFRKGWFVYTPMMLMSFIGFPFLFTSHKKLFIPLLIYIIIYIYVVLSWWCWWYGGSFGLRAFIQCSAFLSIPMAALYSRIEKIRFGFASLSFVLLLLISLNQFQIYQYRHSLIHWDSMTKKYYWAVFGTLQHDKEREKLLQAPDYEKALIGKEE